MTVMQRIARRVVLGLLGRLRAGQLTVLEGERRLVLGHGSPRATVRVRSPRLWPRLLHGSRGLAEAYMHGLWDSPDLTAVVRVAARNATGLDKWRRRVAPARVPLQAARGIRARNTPARSRRDIAAHYDLGNELFALMLDETMMYSSAYFPSRGMTLAQASRAKLRAGVSQARSASRRPRAGDRHGMGRSRRPRREHEGSVGSRPPRSRTSSASTPVNGCRRPGSPIESRCCARTIATCADTTRSSSASR